MHHSVHNLVPIPAFLHDALDRAVDAQKVLHLPDVLCLLRNRVVFLGKPQRLLETGVLLLRHQETQTQIGQPDGDGFPHGLDALRNRRRNELNGIGLVVGLGGQDERLAAQVLISAGGDV